MGHFSRWEGAGMRYWKGLIINGKALRWSLPTIESSSTSSASAQVVHLEMPTWTVVYAMLNCMLLSFLEFSYYTLPSRLSGPWVGSKSFLTFATRCYRNPPLQPSTSPVNPMHPAQQNFNSLTGFSPFGVFWPQECLEWGIEKGI